MLLGLCVATGLACHAWTRRFAPACAASALLAATLFIAGDTIRRGHVDPFFPIAWIVAALVGLAVSAAVGLVVRAIRGRDRGGGPAGRPR